MLSPLKGQNSKSDLKLNLFSQPVLAAGGTPSWGQGYGQLPPFFSPKTSLPSLLWLRTSPRLEEWAEERQKERAGELLSDQYYGKKALKMTLCGDMQGIFTTCILLFTLAALRSQWFLQFVLLLNRPKRPPPQFFLCMAHFLSMGTISWAQNSIGHSGWSEQGYLPFALFV